MSLTISEISSGGDWATWSNQDFAFLDPILDYAQPLFDLVCCMMQKKKKKKWEKNGCLSSPDFVQPFFSWLFCLSCHAQATNSAKEGLLIINPIQTLSCLTKRFKVKITMILFLYNLLFYRVLIRVTIVQETLIKQVPLVVDTWGKTKSALGYYSSQSTKDI